MTDDAHAPQDTDSTAPDTAASDTDTAVQDDAPADFASLGLLAPLVEAVEELGYEEPTPIQREAIPLLIEGRDVLGLAATGTGKTAAFSLPLLQRLRDVPDTGRPAALVLVPTRELAVQVAEAVHRYGRNVGVRVLPIYGGSSMGKQLRALRRGVDVVVATPGRALDHLKRGTLALGDVRYVVLDEADEMLDMGFQEDLEEILAATPDERQTALFSATFQRRLRDVADRTLNDPVRLEVERETAADGESPLIRQIVYVVRRHDKRAALCRVLDMEDPDAALVFCRTRVAVEDLTEALQSRGYAAEALHGGLNQAQRDRAMGKLKAEHVDVIVATDVAARGLDVDHLSHVVNFDAPPSPDQYTHRIGRTGRAGREGTAITFLEPRERRLAHRIEQVTGQSVEQPEIPSAAALRARRLNVLREQVLAAAREQELEPFRAVCDSLADELEPAEIAAAALHALHRASWNDDLEEIQTLSAEKPRKGRWDRREDRDQHSRGHRRDDRHSAGPRGGHGGGHPDGRHGDGSGQWTRLFIPLGRRARIRAGDFVGAILNETGLPKDVIGRIEIAFNVSFVEVQNDVADQVIDALSRTTLRGRQVRVRRDRNQY